MLDLFQLLLLVATVACGLVGLVAFAGMTFVAKRLTRLNRQRAADQMLAFISALVCVALMLMSLPRWNEGETDWSAMWALLGGGFYLLGAFVMIVMVTGHIRTHVNVASDERQDPALWPVFVGVWRIYCVLPAFGGIGAAMAFLAALLLS